MQAKSIVCKRNREKVKSNHCCGSKSFLHRRDELVKYKFISLLYCITQVTYVYNYVISFNFQKDNDVGLIEFYKMTHCKEGVWAATAAEENYVSITV